MAGARAGTVYVDVEPDLDHLQRAIRRQMRPLGKEMGQGLNRGFERELAGVNKSMGRTRRESEGLTNSVLRLKLVGGALALGPAASSLNALAAGGVAAVGSLEPLVGTLAVIPSLASAAGQGLATISLGTSGISDTLKAANDQIVSGSADASAALDREHTSAEQLRSAERALADTRRQSKVAQEDLTAALKEGERQVEDMARAVERSRTAEKGSIKSLRDARRELRKLELDPEANERTRSDARLRVKEAEEDLEDTRVQLRRERKDLAETRKGGGVEHLPAVADARRALAESNRSVAEASHQVAEAQRDATKAMDKQSAATSRYREQLDQLSPPARHFVETLLGYRPVLKDLQEASARGLLPGAEKGLAAASHNAGVLENVLEGTGNALGDIAEDIGVFFGRDAVGRDLEIQGERNTVTIRRFGKGSLYLADALRHVTIEAGPLVDWITESAVAWAKATDEEAKHARQSGELADSFEDTRFILERLVSITGHLGSGMHAVFGAGKADGDELWLSIDRLFNRFDDWASSIEGQQTLRDWFADGRASLIDLGDEIERRVHQFQDLRREGRSTFDAFAITLSDTISAALSASVENMARRSPELAEAFIHGFFTANAWGRLALTGFLLAKFGGLGAFRALGSQTGGAYSTGFAAAAVPELAAVAPPAGMPSPFFSPTHGPQAPVGAFSEPVTARRPSDLRGAFVHRDLGPQAPIPRRPFGMAGWTKDPRSLVQRAQDTKVGNFLIGRGPTTSVGAKFGTQMGAAAAPELLGSLGAGLAAGIPGIAITAGLLFAPEFIKAIDDKAHPIAKNGLPKTGDALSKSLRTGLQRIELEDLVGGDPGQILSKVGGKLFGDFLGGDLTDAEKKLRSFGDTASATFKRLNAEQDVDGMRQMANQARRLAKEFPDASKELTAFARAADRSAGDVQRTVEAQRKAGRMSDQFARNLRGLRLSGTDDFNQLVNSVVTGSRNILRVGGKNSEKTREEVSRQFGIAERRIKTSMDRDVGFVDEGTRRLNELAKKQLGLYGIKAGRVNVVLAKGVGGEMRPHQRGGEVVPGIGAGDRPFGPLPTGSFVLNREATAAFGLNRGGMVDVALEPGERYFLPHEVRKIGSDTLAAMNSAVPRFQQGGPIGLQDGGFVRVPGDPDTTGGRDKVAAAIAGEVSAWIKKFHAQIGYAYDPGGGHLSPGHNITGTATDVVPGPGGSWDTLEAGLRAFINANPGNQVLYGTNGVGTPYPNHGRGNHAHIEWGGARPVPGAGMAAVGRLPDIARVVLKGPPSVALEAGQGALDRIRSAAQASIGRAAQAGGSSGSTGPHSVPGGGFGDLPGGGSDAALMKAISQRKGWNFADWWEVDRRESSHGQNTVNPTSTARTRGQFLDFNWGKYGPGSDPRQNPSMRDQVISMARYIQERYGNPTAAREFHDAHNYYARGGPVGYIGDSLGVGTVGAGGLRSKLKGHKLHATVDEGQSSPWGVGVLKGWNPDDLAALVFDLGTNDDPAGILSGSLASVKSMIKDLPLVLATIAAGKDPKGKNQIIGRQGAKIANWAGVAGPYLTDGIHPTAAGYKQRASLIATAINTIKGKPFKKETKDALRTSKDQLRAKKTKRRTRKREGRRNRRRDAVLDGLTLDPKVVDIVNSAEDQIQDREALFSIMEGNFNLDDIITQTELDALVGDKVGIRNLVGGEEFGGGGLAATLAGTVLPGVLGKIATLTDRIDKWRARVSDNLAQIKKKERDAEKLQDRIDKLTQKVKHVNGKKRPTKVELADRDAWRQEIKEKTQQRTQLVDLDIPALQRDNKDLTGAARPKGFTDLEPDSVLGTATTIMDDLTSARDDWQERLRPGGLQSEWSSHDLAAKALIREGPTKIDPADDDSERNSILAQLLREANQRTAVSEAHFKVLSTAGDLFPPYGGTFHEGGIVPGPPTQERTTILRGKEGVFTEEQMAAMSADGGSYEPHVTVSFANGMEWLERFVEVKVQQVTRGQARSRAPLPGRAGVLR